MPPGRSLNRPACANPYAMATEPTAVTSHESSEMAPICAMFAGNMMIPEPIMFTMTINVSWTRLIFFCGAMVSLSPVARASLPDPVRVELDPVVDSFLEHALDLVVEARKSVERLLE